jgi:hypothetical protein
VGLESKRERATRDQYFHRRLGTLISKQASCHSEKRSDEESGLVRHGENQDPSRRDDNSLG